jgi:hypothetical protein
MPGAGAIWGALAPELARKLGALLHCIIDELQ